MRQNVDLAVIGTGEAGSSAAYGVREAGWTVAVIDELPFGGTCALRGCDPKKILVGAGELLDWMHRMEGHGIRGDSRIAWADLMQFKRSIIDPRPPQHEAQFRAAGISTFHGPAQFLDEKTLRVGDDVIESRHIAIATGARPATLDIPGEELLLTSDAFLELPELPETIIFVGGGYIAFEFAHLSARAGARAIILQRGEHALTGFDPQLVSQLVELTRATSVDVRLASEVIRIEKSSNGFRVMLRTAGEEQVLECDLAVHAAGRTPNLKELSPDVAGVMYSDAGISVNEYLQSRTNPRVYAAGDSADGGGLPLTPVAGAEGDLIARNLLDSNRYTMAFSGLASIVYTVPALGMTGLTELQARSRGLLFTVHEGDSTEWYSSLRVRARRAAYRILVEDQTNHVLGAHILGPHTEELVNVFSLAIRERIPANRLGSVLFAYPTASSDIQYMIQ